MIGFVVGIHIHSVNFVSEPCRNQISKFAISDPPPPPVIPVETGRVCFVNEKINRLLLLCVAVEALEGMVNRVEFNRKALPPPKKP